jgi:hypothetical protein
MKWRVWRARIGAEYQMHDKPCGCNPRSLIFVNDLELITPTVRGVQYQEIRIYECDPCGAVWTLSDWFTGDDS